MSDTATTEAPPAGPATEPATTDGLQALLDETGLTPEQIKGRLEASRKWETRAKANADAQQELDNLRQQSMSDQEKAVEAARSEERTKVLQQVGTQLVDSAVKAATAGRGIDVDALLEGLDRSRFLTEDMGPDEAAISAWVDRIAPKDAKPPIPDLGQGQRGGQNMPLNGDGIEQALKSKLGIS